jgi:hypothetical protein
MTKLLNAYRANRSVSNACKVHAYDRAHMMAACLLSADQCALLADAIAIARAAQ